MSGELARQRTVAGELVQLGYHPKRVAYWSGCILSQVVPDLLRVRHHEAPPGYSMVRAPDGAYLVYHDNDYLGRIGQRLGFRTDVEPLTPSYEHARRFKTWWTSVRTWGEL